MAKELSEVLSLLMETAEPEVQLESVKLLLYLVSTLSPEYFRSVPRYRAVSLTNDPSRLLLPRTYQSSSLH